MPAIEPSLSPAAAIPQWLRLLRLLPARTPGKSRLARWCIHRALKGREADISTCGLTFRVPSTHEPVAMGLIADGQYETGLCRALSTILHADSIFFDVGANVGVFSLFSAQQWCPKGRVLGFEASPLIYSYLHHNAQRHQFPALKVFNRAVTEHSGDHLTFYDAPLAKFGMGSLVNRFGTSGVEVQTISLDEAAAENNIARVDVIKVDVEGFELGVFKGATHLLSQIPAPIIFFEFNDWAEERDETHAGDAQRYLHDMGYITVPLDAWLRGDRSPHDPVVSGGTDLVAFKSNQTHSK